MMRASVCAPTSCLVAFRSAMLSRTAFFPAAKWSSSSPLAATASQEKERSATGASTVGANASSASVNAAALRARIFTVPNALSLARLFAAPVVGWCVVTEAPASALAIFLAAGVLDWADGAVARRWPSQASLLGSFLDPLADKALIACTALPLMAAGALHPAFVALAVGRDVALLGGSMLLRARAVRPPGEAFFSLAKVPYAPAPTAMSKVNTALQLAAVTAALAAQTWPAAGIDLAVLLATPAAPALRIADCVDACSLAATATTAWTGAAYLREHGHTPLQ